MVFAVYMPAQDPAPGQATRSSSARSPSVIRSAANAPTASNTSWTVTSRSRNRPGMIVPPYRNTVGTFSRAAAMTIPGRLLSHPAMVTAPSSRSAWIISSTESAITSRDTRDARIPSWPMAMASETAMVVNSTGTAPAARTPSLAAAARRFRWMLHGVTSFQEEATPTWGRAKPSSVKPTARSMDRAGARAGPSVTSRLRPRHASLGISALLGETRGSLAAPPEDRETACPTLSQRSSRR